MPAANSNRPALKASAVMASRAWLVVLVAVAAACSCAPSNPTKHAVGAAGSAATGEAGSGDEGGLSGAPDAAPIAGKGGAGGGAGEGGAPDAGASGAGTGEVGGTGATSGDGGAATGGAGGTAGNAGQGGAVAVDPILPVPDPTFTCDEGFEGAVAGWTVEGGQWAFGQGNVNEPAPLVGSKLAGTVLGAHYGESVDARLISAPIVVPAASHYPRFKYAYWYDFGTGDYGQLQIREVAGAWQDVAAGRLEQSSMGWSQRVIDLRPFAGKTVQIGFRIVSDVSLNSASNGYGWYLDNVSCQSGPAVLQQPEGFEAAEHGDWSVEGGQWAFGHGNVNELAPLVGTAMAGTVLGDRYGSNVDARLISPEIYVPAASQYPRFKYSYFYDFGAGDYGQLEIRVNGGAWLSVDAGRLDQSSKTWSQRVVDLRAYAGNVVQLAFRIVTDTSTSNGSTSGYGYYVDQASLETGPWVFTNPEGFEGTDHADWSVEGGQWAFGFGNVNERAPLAGTKMAGTVLGGRYGSNVDARLISPEITVPAADQDPRFKFSYFYDFGTGDHGQLELRTSGGAWQSVAAGYLDQSSDSWSQRVLDLRPYAGQTIQVAFRIVSDTSTSNGTTSGYGYYVDQFSLETGAAVFNQPEGFETADAMGDWSAEGGQWAFGYGNVNELPAHTGTRCAGTVFGGYYGSNVDARLVSPEIAVPSAANNPRFKYSYWYDFGAGDYAQVELRIVGGAWQVLPRGKLDQTSETWSQRVVDLRPYAGQKVQLSFRIVTDTSTGSAVSNGFGFYIDDAVVETGAPLLNNPEGFESVSPGDWSVEGGQWAFGYGNVNELPAHAGTRTGGTVQGGRYGSNVDALLISPEFVVPANCSVNYYDWYDFGTGDYAQLQVKPQGGDWQDVLGSQIIGTNKVWTARSLDLHAYAGSTVQVGFRIVTDLSTSNATTSGYGWYIDDVAITGL